MFHLQTSIFTPMEGQDVITATLNFAPAETSHETSYVCQILGEIDTNVAVNVFVDAGDYWKLFIFHTTSYICPTHPFIHSSTSYPFIHQYINILPFAHTFVYPFIHPPTYLSFTHPFVHSFVCSSIIPSVYSYIHPFVH